MPACPAAARAKKRVSMPKLSVQEIKAVAETAISARQKATDAKAALDASPDDESLQTTLKEAEEAATDAEAKAEALSQNTPPADPEKDKRIAKLKRKRAIITSELNAYGEADEADDDDEDAEDPDRPITLRDLQRIEAEKAAKNAAQMAEAIQDPAAREAVKSALKIVVPSGDPQTDFKRAVAVASQDKNLKVLEELARKGIPAANNSGAGAPARRQEDTFTPTPEEARYMRAPFNLSEKEILAARG